MLVIEPHVHVWKADPKRYPWSPLSPRPPAAEATVEMLWERLRPFGVAGAVLVQPIHYGWDNRYVGDCLRAWPGRTAGVCLVDPEDPAAATHLERWVRDYGFEGLRLSPYRYPDPGWLTSPALDPLWEKAGELGISICILARQRQLPLLEPVAARFPEVKVVIDHMAWPSLDDREPAGPLLRLAALPNVYVKVTAPWVFTREAYPYRDTHALIERVVWTFSPERCLWGTDWPHVEQHCGYGRALDLYRREFAFLTDADREWILGRTVLRLYPRSFAGLAQSGGG